MTPLELFGAGLGCGAGAGAGAGVVHCLRGGSSATTPLPASLLPACGLRDSTPLGVMPFEGVVDLVGVVDLGDLVDLVGVVDLVDVELVG